MQTIPVSGTRTTNNNSSSSCNKNRRRSSHTHISVRCCGENIMRDAINVYAANSRTTAPAVVTIVRVIPWPCSSARSWSHIRLVWSKVGNCSELCHWISICSTDMPSRIYVPTTSAAPNWNGIGGKERNLRKFLLNHNPNKARPVNKLTTIQAGTQL